MKQRGNLDMLERLKNVKYLHRLMNVYRNNIKWKIQNKG